MTCTIFSVAGDGGSKIGIMQRPSGGEILIEDIRSIRDQGFSVVVSLLTDAEQSELKLEEEAKLCKKLEVTFDRMPIPDLSVPTLDDEIVARLAELRKLRAAGNSIVVHCRAASVDRLRSPRACCCRQNATFIPRSASFPPPGGSRFLKLPNSASGLALTKNYYWRPRNHHD